VHLSAFCHAEEAKSFCAKRKIILSRMIFRLAAEKNSVMTKAMVTSLRGTAET